MNWHSLPRVVFLDWAGTLSDSAFWGHWREQAPGDWRTIQGRLFANDGLVHRWMPGSLTAEEIVGRLVSGTDQDGGRWIAELERSCREMRLIDASVWRLVPTLRSMGIQVVIATDNMDTFPRWTVPAMELKDLVDDILDSWTLGVLSRDQGHGSRLLAAAEDGARRRGCRSAHLDTLSFQAERFYLKHGYTEFGRLPDLPVGHSRVYMRKALA